jgi:glucan biosynthesis protein C
MTAHVGAQVREMPEKAGVAVRTRAAGGARLLFMDNLRVFLTILVVLHHLSISYGSGVGSWYYHDSASPLTQIVFSLFIILNQGYFMGLFFLISGYFSAASMERKSWLVFIKDRLIRLGIPLVVFSVLINTLPLYINAITEGNWHMGFGPFFVRYIQNLEFQTGPMWFIEALLVFSIVYAGGRAVWDRIRKHLPANSVASRPLTNVQIVVFTALMAVSLFIVRIYFPTGKTWHNWELGFFPEYVLMFAAGILAHRFSWLPDLSAKISKTWKIIAVATILALMPMFLVGGGLENLDPYNGGLTWQSVMTCIWFAIYPVAMSILMLDVFRNRIDVQGRMARLLSKNAYTVYIIHAPVIVYLAYLTRFILIDPFIKFFVMAVPAVILSFAVSYLIRRIPLTDKVL